MLTSGQKTLINQALEAHLSRLRNLPHDHFDDQVEDEICCARVALDIIREA